MLFFDFKGQSKSFDSHRYSEIK